MSDSSIEMINKSLRSCSLNGRRRTIRSPAVTSPPPGRRRREREVTVELNSGIPLPCFWEQRLDIRTGQMHYRNWRTGETTSIDPRLYNTSNSSSTTTSEETVSSHNDSSSEDNGNRYFNSDLSSESSSSSSSSSVSSSSSYTSQANVPEPQVLILAGCQRCYLYLMVPKNDLSCPQCSRLLLDLSGRTP